MTHRASTDDVIGICLPRLNGGLPGWLEGGDGGAGGVGDGWCAADGGQDAGDAQRAYR